MRLWINLPVNACQETHPIHFYLEFGNFLHQKIFFDPPIFKYIHNTNQPKLNYLLLQPGPLKLGVQRLVATAPAF